MQSSPGVDDYWASQIQAIQASCYVHPANPKQVSTAVRTAVKYQCQFAIRGNGHSGIAGASNLANGMVLNLDQFKGVTLSKDKKSALVGAGSQWGDVYSSLDAFNYTVVGGRETTVGVGGLTLGGGISFFSGRYGFACDNVLAYEVVLADGTIAKVSQQSRPDLYRALRGGGNNFAVVTSYHFAAYHYDLLQGGFEVYGDSPTTQKGVLDAFGHFAQTGQDSPDANMYISLSYSNNAPLWITGLSYANPSPPIPAVSAYKQFYTAELNASKIFSTRRTSNHTDFATELGLSQPSGKRQQFHTRTYTANVQLLHDVYNVYRQVVSRIQKQLVGTNETFTPSLAFLPVTTNILAAQSQRGGNVLGLDDSKPLMIASMAWPWSDAGNDELFNGGMEEIIKAANGIARKRGLLNDFIYMNYASAGLPVVQGYGKENVKFLKGVSKSYDPQGVFQKLVPGGFKLP